MAVAVIDNARAYFVTALFALRILRGCYVVVGCRVRWVSTFVAACIWAFYIKVYSESSAFVASTLLPSAPPFFAWGCFLIVNLPNSKVVKQGLVEGRTAFLTVARCSIKNLHGGRHLPPR
eukprot:scaffold191706_cov30-Tisochrysis_lutea.AAC.3